MNGYLWTVCFVDPESHFLIDRTDQRRVATTDPSDRCIYVANNLRGQFLRRVLTHELGHAAMFCYNLIPDIYSAVKPEHHDESEEWLCNFMANHADEIIDIVNKLM